MNKKVKSTLVISGIAVGVIVVGLFVYKTFIKPRTGNKNGGGGDGNTPPVPQATITREAAMSIANTLQSEMDGCNTYFVDAFKNACKGLQNSLDWQLVVDAFGSRTTDGCAPFNYYTGNLITTMKWELDTDELSQCRAYLNSKGINSAL